MISLIDTHVHLRDEEQKAKETIAHGLKVAEDSGLVAVFDEPNTKRPVTTRQRVLERFALAEAADSPIFYGTYVGLTPNKDQLKEFIEAYREFSPEKGSRFGVVGGKLFMGKSVGSLSVTDRDQQEFIYATLKDLKYGGLVANHCEKQSLIVEAFDPRNPISHSNNRPEESEVESVKDLIRILIHTKFAYYGQPGKIRVEHVSVPESVDRINQFKQFARIYSAVTPLSLLLNNSLMNEEEGSRYKVNPPLRTEETRAQLFEYFLRGRTDVLQTDHAPHTLGEKTGEPDEKGNPQYLSGIPGLASWPDFTQLLIERGATPELIEKMAYNTVCTIHGFNVPQPFVQRQIKPHTGDYAFDPYALVE